MTSFALRPCALDVVKHCADLRVAQHASEAWHVAFVAAADDCGGPFLDDPEKHVVGMVPRMTGFIMWRRWQPARGKRRAPIRLAFQVRAVDQRDCVQRLGEVDAATLSAVVALIRDLTA